MANNPRRKPPDEGPQMPQRIATTEAELIGAVASIDARLEAVEKMMGEHRGDTRAAFAEMSGTLAKIRGEVKQALDAAISVANAAAAEATKANTELTSLKRTARWLWGVVVTTTIGAAWLYDRLWALRSGPHS